MDMVPPEDPAPRWFRLRSPGPRRRPGGLGPSGGGAALAAAERGAVRWRAGHAPAAGAMGEPWGSWGADGNMVVSWDFTGILMGF